MTPNRMLALRAAIAIGLAAAAVPGAFALCRRSGGAAASEPAPAQAAAARTVRAEGRLQPLPGAQVTVGTEAGGTLVLLAAQEKQRVRKGEVLALLRCDEQRAALAEAEAQVREAAARAQEAAAQVAEAEAGLKLAEQQHARARLLVDQRTAPPEQLDRAERDRSAAAAQLSSANARRESAEARRQLASATAARLQAVVAKARIAAPIDGVVLERLAQEGETVAAGAGLLTLADLSRTRIEAEVDEYDAAVLRAGAAVEISAEGWPGARWKGRVEEIPDRVVPRRLKPEDPGRPSDTRVLLVKVALLEPVPVKLGQRVEVAIAR